MPRSGPSSPSPRAKDAVAAEKAPTGDLYTMAEAAELKGVSYHTVSRAVRRGKLPAQRLGRMALLTASDLRTWRPMRERAPHKYRRRDPNPEATPTLLDLASGDRVELARRLSTLLEVLHGAAAELPLDAFLTLLTDRLAGALDFRRVTLWGVDPDRGQATRLTRHGVPMSNLPGQVSIAESRLIKHAINLETAHVVDDAMRFFDAESHALINNVGPVFVAPLRIGERTLGLLLCDRLRAPISLSPEQLVLAQSLANQAALAMDRARLRAIDRDRADQLAAIIENVEDAVLACDADGKLTLINAAGRNLLGMDRATLGSDIRDGHAAVITSRHEFDGTPIAPSDTPLPRAFRGERVRNHRHIVTRSDGTVRAVSVSAQPIVRVADGGITGAVSVLRDITDERAAAEREARRIAEAERIAERAAAVADVALAVNAATDFDQVLRSTTVHLTTLLGGVHSSILLREGNGKMVVQYSYGSNGEELTGSEIEAGSVPTTMIAFARRAPVFYTYAEAAPSERAYFDRLGVRSAIIAPLIVQDELIGVGNVEYDQEDYRPTSSDLAFAAALANQCAVAIDKTRLLDRIDSAHRRLLAVVDQLPQGIVIVDSLAQRVVLANRAAELLWGTGLPSSDATRLGLADAEGSRFAAGENPIERTLKSGHGRTAEPLTILREDGAQVSVLGTYAPVLDANERIVGVVCVLQNVADFRQLDRAKDEFLSVAAHELRNPLTSLHGNLQLLLRRVQKDADRQDEAARLRLILAQSDRLAQLVGRLLDVSRADLGRLDLTMRPVDAGAMVSRIVEAAPGLGGARWISRLGLDHLGVVWDEIRVEQILTNLLTNAIKYGQDSAISVTLSRSSPDTVRIAVEDRGPGISDAAKARLFDRYYREADDLPSNATGTDDVERIDGLGLGLYVSRKIARAHGGDLMVSDGADGGACFVLELPRDGTAIPIDQPSMPRL